MRRISNAISYCLAVALMAAFVLGLFASYGGEAAVAAAANLSPGGGSFVSRVVREEELYPRRVYLGGQSVGFMLDLDGVLVSEFHDVDTGMGPVRLKSDLKEGDLIKKIDGVEVDSAEDVIRALNGGEARTSFEFTVARGTETLTFGVSPLIDRVSGEYRLGIGVRTELGGIGTVTFVRRDGRFAALGHAVGGLGGESDVEGGKVYGCRITGLERGAKGRAGSIKGALVVNEPLGIVDKSTRFGLYGTLDAAGGQLYDTGGREDVKCGRAYIVSSLSGRQEFYDAEIVRASYQAEPLERGMVIKVTDKRLIGLTGGIVQGMSGSPIVQNDKIVGAVTHVFVNDPLRGYGIYLDWMLNNSVE